jgi:hypothetical protein
MRKMRNFNSLSFLLFYRYEEVKMMVEMTNEEIIAVLKGDKKFMSAIELEKKEIKKLRNKKNLGNK